MKKNGNKYLLMTELWNNESIFKTTGYSINDIKGCLTDVAEFIAQNLSPNRLANFDIKAIKSVEPYDDIPNNLNLNLFLK